ncbi:MOSC domain-containing protein [Sphingomonas sp.]|jgi:MOSC domain-containing protein YiiM|uniref:MOSC domain-containing protein n=1 Tax=Sphingomonas sp. TaxID=28214 RepID=UPI002ED8EE61
MMGQVIAVAAAREHRFSKQVCDTIRLVAGLGVVGDAHGGETVKHRSRVARDPTEPNLRQVHLLHAELLDELAGKGFAVRAGDIGENVLVRGIALLDLPEGAVVHLGESAQVRVTGLRNPCSQLDDFAPGLMRATLDRDARGRLVRKAGVMAVVIADGAVRGGDAVTIALPPPPHRALGPV